MGSAMSKTADSIESPGKTSSKTADYLVVVMLMLFLIAFMAYLAYLYYLDEENTKRDREGFSCVKGQCKINLISGIKTCPQEGESTVTLEAEEICQGATTCPRQLPYPINEDQSTGGTTDSCENGKNCNCSSRPRCQPHISAALKLVKGNLFGEGLTEEQRDIVFQPKNAYQKVVEINTDPVFKTLTYLPPMELEDHTTEFCTISAVNIKDVYPSCPTGRLSIISGIKGFDPNDDHIPAPGEVVTLQEAACISVPMVCNYKNSDGSLRTPVYDASKGKMVGYLSDTNTLLIDDCVQTD